MSIGDDKPAIAVDGSSSSPHRNRVYVVWSRLSHNGVFSIVLSSSDDDGRTWTRIVKVNRTGRPLREEATPVAPAPRRVRPDEFWPASAVDASTGVVWVCFYDTGGDPARKTAFFSCTVSHDGGRSWVPRVHAASVASDETQPAADLRQYGDYEGLAVTNGVAHPIWTDSRDIDTLGEEIYTTRLTGADVPAPAASR